MSEHVFPPPEALLEHAAFVRAVARAALQDEDLADDVVQDTWVAALERPPRPRKTLRAWLVGVVRRKAVDAVRRESAIRRRERAGARPEAGGPDPEDVAVRAETGRRLVEAVLALDEPYRGTVLLRFYDGLAPRAIARRQGVPVETVRTRLKRGLARLRSTLEDAYGRRSGGWRTALLPLLALPRGEPTVAALLAGGGALMAKKLGVALAALVLLGGVSVWWVLERERRTAPPPAPLASPARLEVAAVEEEVVAPPEVAAAPEIEPPRLEGRAVPPAPPPTPEEAPPPRALAAVDRERDLHGTVVRTDGSPVAGALLETRARPWDRPHFLSRAGWQQESVAGPSTTSAEDGSFRIRLAAGDLVELAVRAQGLAPVVLPGLQAGEKVRVVLREPVRLVVEAQGPGSRPVAGLVLRLWGSNRLRREALTDETGRTVFPDLPPGLGVYLDLKGYQEGWGRRQVERLTLPERGEARHTFVVDPARTLKGRVVDAATRRPIEGARVGSGVSWEGYFVTTDADGRYELPGWSGKWATRLQVAAPGYALAWKGVGQRYVLDFALARGVEVRGRVVDARGEAVEQARLSATTFDEESEGIRWLLSLDSAETDAGGGFSLTGLAPGLEHTLTILAPGHGQHVRKLPALAAGSAVDLGDVLLPDPGAIRAEARALDASPLARVPVLVSLLDSAGPGRSFHHVARRMTDDLGRARFGDLAPGSYVVRLDPRRWPNVQQPVEIPPEGGVVSVDLSPGTRPLRVFVVDEDGAPVEKAVVYAHDGRRILSPVYPDASGLAHLEVLDGVEARIEVLPHPGQPYERPPVETLRPDQDEIAVVLRRADRLRGRLLDPAGKPIPFALVRVEGAAPGEEELRTGAGGGFALRRPPPGPVTLRFEGEVWDPLTGSVIRRPLAVTLEGVSGRARDVVLQATALPADRSLEVRVLDPDGRPLAGVPVRLEPLDGETPTDAAGRTRREGLAAMPVVVRVAWEPSRDRPWLVPPTTEVAPEDQCVELRLVRAVLLEGRMLLPGGAAASGGTVRVDAANRPPLTVAADTNGAFCVFLDPEDPVPVTLVGRSRDANGLPHEAVLEGVRPGRGPVTLRLVTTGGR